MSIEHPITTKGLFTTSSPLAEMKLRNKIASNILKLPAGHLSPGHFSFILALYNPVRHLIDCVDAACPFSIVETGSEFAAYTGEEYGVFFVKCEWEDL